MPAAQTSTRILNLMTASVNTTDVRRETFQGVEHLVVPCVALVEGVIHSSNSAVPELALASEFGRIPVSWNGRPVTLNHPMRDNLNVSASQSPTIFEEEAIGFLFNTILEDDKLKTEAWINLDTVAKASTLTQETIARFESPVDEKDIVEVSTGLFTNSEAKSGKFNGLAFNGIWRDIVPDHFAILPKGVIGACSVKDGCGGPRMNMKVNCSCDPKDNKEVKPAEDKPATPTANNTLVLDDADNVSAERGRFLRGLKEKFAGIFFNANKVGELSDADIRMAIASALKAEDSERWYDIIAVFNKEFVYSSSWDGSLDQRSYKISSNGSVALGSEKVRVRPETTFVPVTVKEDSRMNKKEVIDALITNSATQFEESDRVALEAMSEDMLDKVNKSAAKEVTKEAPKETTANTVVQPIVEPTANAKVATVEEFLASAPVEMRSVLTEGIRMQKARKDQLVTDIVANKRNAFSDVELRAMEIPQLEKLAKLADLPSYEGRSPSVTANSSADNAVPAAIQAFPSKA